MNYDDFKRYEKYKLNQNNIENIVEEMKKDYMNMKDVQKEMTELKLKDMKAEMDKIALLSIIISILFQFGANIFKLVEGEAAWSFALFIIYVFIARTIGVTIRLYRIFNLYLNVIDGLKNNKQQLNGIKTIEGIETVKNYMVKIKKI